VSKPKATEAFGGGGHVCLLLFFVVVFVVAAAFEQHSCRRHCIGSI
jgi:hypothetical protein